MSAAVRYVMGLRAPLLVMFTAALLSLATLKLFFVGQAGLVVSDTAMTAGHVSAALLALFVSVLTCGLALKLGREGGNHDGQQAAAWLTAGGGLMGGAMYAGVILALFEPGPDASPALQRLDVFVQMLVTATGVAGMVAAFAGFGLAWLSLRSAE